MFEFVVVLFPRLIFGPAAIFSRDVLDNVDYDVC